MATLLVERLRERLKISSHPCEWDEIARSGVLRGEKPLKQVEPMVQTKRRRKWKCHVRGSSIFFDDVASQRYYLPISSPPHRKEQIRGFSRETDVGNMF